MKAKPPRAIGSLSASLILSISEVKYSSGSFSLVNFFGSSSPSPKPIFMAVFGVVALAFTKELLLTGVDGVKAEVAITRARSMKETMIERAIVGRFSNGSFQNVKM